MREQTQIRKQNLEFVAIGDQNERVVWMNVQRDPNETHLAPVRP
jgi:hypothetical protein